jgi:hypothetical protein
MRPELTEQGAIGARRDPGLGDQQAGRGRHHERGHLRY